MDVRTHAAIDRTLCGTPLHLAPGQAVVEMQATAAMAADAHGLVHGGFVFGLADHAAMLAVNEPTVVLVAAETRFLRPVRPGDRLRAEATVSEPAPPRYAVRCTVSRAGEPVFEGLFQCHVPRRHVLDRGPA
jgi:acyl-coenzyme A thioesterase PaaI-like protein